MAFAIASGFLPPWQPLEELPASHAALEAIVSSLPRLLSGDGAELAAAVASLPALPLPSSVDELAAATRAASVETLAVDVPALLRAVDAPAAALVHALYRDYALLTSALCVAVLHPAKLSPHTRTLTPNPKPHKP